MMMEAAEEKSVDDQRLMNHLKNCDGCRAWLSNYGDVLDVLREEPEWSSEDEFSRSFWKAVRGEESQRATWNMRRWPVRVFSFTATAFCLIMMLFFISDDAVRMPNNQASPTHTFVIADFASVQEVSPPAPAEEKYVIGTIGFMDEEKKESREKLVLNRLDIGAFQEGLTL